MIRKIMSKEEIEKKQHRNRVIMSAILGVILLLSTAGYFVMDFNTETKASSIVSRGITFIQTDYGTFTFTIDNYNFETKFLPDDTGNISAITTKTLSTYNSQPLYFAGYSTEDISQIASQEISKNLGQFVARVNFACLNESCVENYPIKTCDTSNLLIFKKSESNSSAIYEDNKCLVLRYAPFDEDRVADAFIYTMLGIN